MEIVIPKIEDCEAVNKLAVQVHDCHVAWRPDFFNSCDELIAKEDLAEMIDNESIFVAKVDGDIVGYASIIVKVREHKGFRYRKQLDIDSICIDKEHRRKGIGTELLKFIKNYALEKGCTDIALNVNPENVDAIRLYEKAGFEIRHIMYSTKIK